MNTTSEPRTYSHWPHSVAVLLTCATFPLIWVGGLVTTYDAGMAVPDWPSTYGYNLFEYPWQTWIAGPFDLFIEHGHRLLGALVGFITIGLVLTAFLSDRRPWLRVVSVIALLGVIGQGALGGMRVLFDDRQLAMIHGCVGPAFFALTAAIAVFTSRYWREATVEMAVDGRKVQRLSLITVSLAYLQLVLGAGLRHLPIDATVGYFRSLVVFHLVMAVAVLVHAILLFKAVNATKVAGLRGRAVTVLVLVLVQISLGTATWIVKYGWPSWFANWAFAASYTVQTNSLGQAITTTAHVANGSLILANTIVIAVRSLRVFPFLGDERQRAETQRRTDSRDTGTRSSSLPRTSP